MSFYHVVKEFNLNLGLYAEAGEELSSFGMQAFKGYLQYHFAVPAHVCDECYGTPGILSEQVTQHIKDTVGEDSYHYLLDGRPSPVAVDVAEAYVEPEVVVEAPQDVFLEEVVADVVAEVVTEPVVAEVAVDVVNDAPVVQDTFIEDAPEIVAEETPVEEPVAPKKSKKSA